MINLKDEYQKYYLEILSKDYQLKYPKMMRLFFKGFKYEPKADLRVVDMLEKELGVM